MAVSFSLQVVARHFRHEECGPQGRSGFVRRTFQPI
jgi:hypothetical protein